MMETTWFKQLIPEVAAWSRANFGDQDGLEAIAPLLGIIEETLYELPRDHFRRHSLLDAISDALIFCADFFGRAGVPPDVLEVRTTPRPERMNDVMRNLTFAVGSLCQASLKSRQRIRGYGTDTVHPALVSAAAAVFWALTDVASQWGYSNPEPIVTETWKRVRQRRWRVAAEPQAAPPQGEE